MLDTLSAETRQALIQEVAAAVRQDADFRAQIQADLLQKLFHPHIQVHVLPGGKKPQPATDGAIGYDVCARSIVSKSDKDPNNANLRKTIFDFQHPSDDPGVEGQTEFRPTRKHPEGEWVYWLAPDEDVLLGAGCVFVIPSPMEIQVRPRSGLATKHGIVLINSPGTVDPDYRGEAGVLLYNVSKRRFPIYRQMRVAQLIFSYTCLPDMEEVANYTELDQTARGIGGFGSTGLR